MPCERAQLNSRRGVPQLDRFVVATARNHFPVETKCDRPDRSGMTFEGAKLHAGRGISQLDRVVIAAASDNLPVGTECD